MSCGAFDGGDYPMLTGDYSSERRSGASAQSLQPVSHRSASDIHISHFITTNEIRRCVTMTNGLKPDPVLLTGDFVSWDSAAAFGLMEKEICIVSNP